MVYFTPDIGLTEEQKDEVENFIRKNFVTRALYDKKMAEQETKIEELTALSKDSSKNKDAYDKLLKDYDALKVKAEQDQKDFQFQMSQKDLDYAIKDILKQEGARSVRIVSGLLREDMQKKGESFQLQEDGSIPGLLERIQAMKKDPETSYMFYEEKIQSSKEVLPPEEPRILFREVPFTNDDFNDRMNSYFGYPRRTSK